MHALLTSERERGYPCTGKHVQATQLPRPPPRQPSSSPAFLMAATSIFSAGCPSSASLRSLGRASAPAAGRPGPPRTAQTAAWAAQTPPPRSRARAGW